MKVFYWVGYALSFAIRLYRIGYRNGAEAASGSLTKDARLARVEQLIRAAADQNYVPAIKLHRELFGTCLKDAKDAVDVIRNRIKGAA